MTNILKTATTVLALFDIEVISNQPARLLSSGIGEMEGDFLCRVKVRRKSTDKM